MEIYQKLKGSDLINFHLAFPNSTSELAPFYNLKANFGYDEDYDLWPIINLERVPKPIEEEWIHAVYDLTLGLRIDSLEIFNGISDELKCKVTGLYIVGSISGRVFFHSKSLTHLFLLSSRDLHFYSVWEK